MNTAENKALAEERYNSLFSLAEEISLFPSRSLSHLPSRRAGDPGAKTYRSVGARKIRKNPLGGAREESRNGEGAARTIERSRGRRQGGRTTTRETEGDRRREAYRKRVHGWVEELVSPSRSPCRGVCFRGRPRDANESRRREREVPFYAARERRRKKREAREHAHVRENARGRARLYACTRVHASVARCLHREETHIRAEGIERARARDRDGERKGEARETGRRIVCMYHQKSVPGY